MTREITCSECGATFTVEGVSAPLTCSNRCRLDRNNRVNALRKAGGLSPRQTFEPFNCSECGTEFQRCVGTGNKRLTCTDACFKARTMRLQEEREDALPLCEGEGCTNHRIGKDQPLCRVHYKRLMRHGELNNASIRRINGENCLVCNEPIPAGRSKASATCGKTCSDLKMRADKYKIPPQEMYVLLTNGGRCQICSAENSHHIDHDHGTGRVRGLLCGTCNSGLGFFKDNVEYLESAARYIRRSSSDSQALEPPTEPAA